MRYAVLLAGGSGVRLWPASRRLRPKQFLPLGASGDESLLAATCRRIAPMCPAEQTVVVTAADQVEAVRRALPDLPATGVIAEPVARNTAPALGLAAIHLVHRDPDAIMGVLPADHHIVDEAGFREVVARAFEVAEVCEAIVTVGIVPTRAETGYGYLHVGEHAHEHAERVVAFVEKPDHETAERYLTTGEYLWNGGMFFVRAAHLLRVMQIHMPETYAGLRAIGAALERGDAQAVTERVYPTLERISIDYGVMEHAADVLTVRAEFGWNDVGSWTALADYRPADEHGNVVQGTVVSHDAADNIALVTDDDDDTAIALIGVSGLVVVKSGNGLLIVPRERAQEVRAAVDELRARGLERYL